MAIISVAIQKGGAGKTTTALNLAAAFREMGQRVLLVDLDPQSHLTQALGIADDPERSIYPFLKKAAAGGELNLLDVKQTVHGIDVVPACLQLSFAEMELVSEYEREYLLDTLLQPLQNQYDQIVVDCPPAVGVLTVNALVASDYVLIPMQAEFLPLKGVLSFLPFLKKVQKLNKRLSILGVVITKYDPRLGMTEEVLRELQQQPDLQNQVLDSRIRVNIALAKAQQRGSDIFTYDSLSNGALNYMSLAYEVMERMK